MKTFIVPFDFVYPSPEIGDCYVEVEIYCTEPDLDCVASDWDYTGAQDILSVCIFQDGKEIDDLVISDKVIWSAYWEYIRNKDLNETMLDNQYF